MLPGLIVSHAVDGSVFNARIKGLKGVAFSGNIDFAEQKPPKKDHTVVSINGIAEKFKPAVQKPR